MGLSNFVVVPDSWTLRFFLFVFVHMVKVDGGSGKAVIFVFFWLLLPSKADQSKARQIKGIIIMIVMLSK